jgi:hypothetical protein
VEPVPRLIGQYASVVHEFDGLLRRVEEATKRSISDVISADESAPMDDADFDDAVWLALCGLIGSASDLSHVPVGVRMYFATRIVEWDVANGGFDQALFNVGEYFEAAKVGYELLGDDASVDLLVRAQSSEGDEAALDALDDALDGPPWNGVPWADERRVTYVREHREEFML